MSRKAPGIIIALLMLCVAHLVAGQELNNKTSPAAAPVITGTASAERLRFTAPSSVVQMQLQIYAESGQLLFDVTSKGNVLDWTLQDSGGQHLASGSYLCVVTVKSLSGKLTQRVGSALVQERQVGLQPAQLTSAQQQAVGPIEENGALTILNAEETQATTVIANNGTEGQMIRGRGALSFRMGDFFSGKDQEQMRLTEDGSLGIGTSTPQAKLDVAGVIRAERFLVAKPAKNGLDQTASGTATIDSSIDSVQPLTGGTGTTGQLAKWTDGANGTLGDSAVTELSGKIGVGTTTPGAPLEAYKAAGANVNGGGLLVSRYNDGAGTFRGGSIYSRFIGGSVNDDALVFGVTSTGTKNPYADFDQARMTILAGGNVGVGTTAPGAPLEAYKPAGINVTGGGLLVSRFNDGAGTFRGGAIYSRYIGGTVNDDALVFGVTSTGTKNPYTDFDQARMAILANGNVGIGTTSPASQLDVAGNINTSTQYNIAGNRVLGVSGGFMVSNTFGGVGAGAATTPSNFDVDGNNNSFFGSAAGRANTTGWQNSFFGAGAGGANTIGSNNSFVGNLAGVSNISGFDNSFFGDRAGVSNLNGQFNSFVGSQAGLSSTGDGNSFVGSSAGVANQSGSNNSFLGTQAGKANTTGSNNTIIGEGADLGAGNLNNATALGSGAIVSQSNSLVLGNGANVGIGTPAPVNILHLNGNHNDFALTFTNQSNTAGLRGYRIAFDSDRLTFQSANDSGAFAANQMAIDPATGNVGIGATAPHAKLQVAGGNIYVSNPNGLIISSPNGTCWLIGVSNAGAVTAIPFPCP